MNDPTLLINILAPSETKTMDKLPANDPTNETGADIFFAQTAKEVRELLKMARSCCVHVVVSNDVSVNVEVSKAAVRRALVDFKPDDEVGGTYWSHNGFFCLDRAI